MKKPSLRNLKRLLAGKPPEPSEAEFQRQVIQYAKANNWTVAHFRPGLNKRGDWQTAVQADGKGFLDLVCVRERVVWAELKSSTGKATVEQQMWMHNLRNAGQEVYLWRPSHWSEIEAVLGK